MPRALLTATVQSHIAQFHEPAIALLHQHGYEVHVAARDNLAQKNGLSLTTPDRVFDVPFERNPLAPRNARAFRELRRIIGEGDYDIIHCNTPVAGVLTRLLGQRARKAGARLVYTAHGFHFFKGAPLVNWVAYYPLERALARFTDVLVTINKQDFARAEGFPAGSVRYVPGVGVDLQRFGAVLAPSAELRREFGLAADDFVVLSVGELNDNKNHATVLRAMAHPAAPRMHYLICGNGPRRQQLEDLARELGVGGRVQFLGYRRDIPVILSLADVFCQPSYREGLPLALMEAMAAGKSVVCSRIRGSVDLVDEGTGGMVVDAGDVAGFANAFAALAGNGYRREEIGLHNRRRVQEFSIRAVLSAMTSVYALPEVP